MQSIFAAMVWETLTRGRWILPLGFLIGNALSLLLFQMTIGRHIDITRSPEFVLWHLMASQTNMLIFGAVIMLAQGKPDRLFTHPITNRTVTAYYMLIAMALMFTESVLSALLINALYGAGWPLWGPALYSAVGLITIYATFWITHHSFWLFVHFTAVAVLGGVWYRLRHGPFDNERLHFWDEVTFVEMLTMVAAALAVYGVGVIATGWRRRGEPPLSVGFVAWVTRWLDPPLELGPPFRSPAQAQHWCERSKKGSVIPASVIVLMVFGFAFWLILDRQPRSLLESLHASGWVLIALGLLGGMACGNTGSGDAHPDMGHFLGTRPITSKAMATILLKVMARGVVAGWLIWLGAVVLLSFILRGLDVVERRDVWFGNTWIGNGPALLLGSLLGSWMSAGVGLSFLLLGRPKAIVIATSVVFGLTIAWQIGSTFFVPPDLLPSVEAWAASLVGIAGSAITGTAFVLAWRNNLISVGTALAGLAFWMLISGVAIWVPRGSSDVGLSVSSILFVTGIASLVAAPLATAPLALSWNRVR
jgi:hypothetical protein